MTSFTFPATDYLLFTVGHCPCAKSFASLAEFYTDPCLERAILHTSAADKTRFEPIV
jgi:hypothetical protein